MQSPAAFHQPQKSNQDKINKITTKNKEDVRLHDLTAADLLSLAKVLRENKSIKSIKLTIKADEIPFPEHALKEVFDTIQNNPQLKILAISFTLCENFGDIGAVLFADFIRQNKNIIGSDLTRTNLGNKGVAALAEALKVNTSMKSINISWNDGFDDQGLTHIIDMCKVNTTLECCFLDKNLGITDAGVTQLAEVMQTREKKIDFHISERHNISPGVVSQLEAACKSEAPRP